MAVLAFVFGNHGPLSFCGCAVERCFQLFERLGSDGWTIDQGDHGGVAAAIQNFLQTDLKRTELAALGVGIDDEGCSVGVDDGGEPGLILARDYYDLVAVGAEAADG